MKSILLLFLLYEQFECAKILVFSLAIGYSEDDYLSKLSDILADADHDVTFLLVGNNPNLVTTKLAKTIRWETSIPELSSLKIYTKKIWESDGISNTFNVFRELPYVANGVCEELLKDSNFIGQLKNESFEFGFCEVFMRCAYALFQKINIDNYATILPSNLREILTDPIVISNNPSYVPTWLSNVGDTMSYMDRFKNFMIYIFTQINGYTVIYLYDRKIHKFSPKYHSLFDSIRQTSFMFVNSDEFLDFPRLITHKVIFIGGIARQTKHSLSTEYQTLLDEAKDGAVLISFGSVAKSSEMSLELKEAFVHTFKSMSNLTFIWKYDNDSDDAVIAPNVVKKNSIPENDVLNHPNLRVFITHCSVKNLIESVYAEVPVICIPLFADQSRNGKIVEKRGIGISLNKMTLQSDVLSTALNDILGNDRYKRMVLKLKQMMTEKPLSSRERFLRNIEYALKFGSLQEYDIAANNLNIFQYFLLDIIIPLIAFFLIFLLLLIKCFRKIFKKLSKKICGTDVKQD